MSEQPKDIEFTPPLVNALRRVVAEEMKEQLAVLIRRIQPPRLMRKHEFLREMRWSESFLASMIAQEMPHHDLTPEGATNQRLLFDPDQVREWLKRRAEA